mgnify:FL=1|jgi:Fe-S-cluster containining protein|tara:strand:- start:19 stop:486 length:468 start_codon:yes stop_codon:yes gene_type:complete
MKDNPEKPDAERVTYDLGPLVLREAGLLADEETKDRENFNCTGCGKCCTYGPYMKTMSADEEDLQRWEDEGRQDILDTADIFFWGGREDRTADLWMDPKTGEERDSDICPWVKKVGKDNWHCTIHELRPNVCRSYPVSKEQRDELECPGLWDHER